MNKLFDIARTAGLDPLPVARILQQRDKGIHCAAEGAQMKLDPREWYLFKLVDSSGAVVDSGYETPGRALRAASDTGTTARVVIPGHGTFPVELSQ